MNNHCPHQGHRARMKARFLKEGFSGFADHEILEFLLYYAMPRKDTNEIAHRLLDTFGSFDRVFDAPISELLKVDEIGEHSAILLSILPEVSRRYRMSKLSSDKNMQSLDTAGNFLVEHYMSLRHEQVTMILLDNRQRMISFEIVHNGSVNSSDVNVRRIVEIAFSKGAASLILAHNHPSGELMPSDSDIATTKHLMNAFSPIDLNMREHILVAGDRHMPIIRYISENAIYEPRYIAVRAEDVPETNVMDETT